MSTVERLGFNPPRASGECQLPVFVWRGNGRQGADAPRSPSGSPGSIDRERAEMSLVDHPIEILGQLAGQGGAPERDARLQVTFEGGRGEIRGTEIDPSVVEHDQLGMDAGETRPLILQRSGQV